MGIFNLFTNPYKSVMKAELIAAKGHNCIDLEKAISYYNEAIRKQPKYYMTYSYRAFAKIHLRDYQGAIKDCNSALLINPQFDWAYINRANAKEYIGDLAGALMDCNTAVEINPENGWAYYRKGMILKRMGEVEMAISEFKLAKTKGGTLADLELDRLKEV